MATLYVVATPIGNLKDITLRALEIFKEVDFVLCEDTRTTKKLLEHYQIEKPLISYHQHSCLKKIDFIINLLKQGKNLALVSEAGTPGISDPGGMLVNRVLGHLGNQVKIVPVPGPSAAITALSISGFPTDKFIFIGFPPHKKGRKKFFEEVLTAKYPVVFYESPYRIIKSLCDLHRLTQIGTPINADISVNPRSNQRKSADREIVVCRELTKKFETIYRGTIEEVINQIKNDKILGEFVIVVNKH